MKYFSKVPLVSYGGQTARNLLAKAQMTAETRRSSTLFYPYTMNAEDRVDVLAYKYYDNPDYAWLVWMANEVVDPYYDMVLSEDNFKAYISKKYGSILTAQTRIKYWRNEWSDDDTVLTPVEYNALPCYYDTVNNINVNTKKYYDPTLDVFNNIYGYSRKKEDWTLATNRTVTFTCTNTGQFIEGEKVRKNVSNYGYVAFSDSAQMSIQHVSGSVENGDTLEGVESGASCVITDVPFIQVTIPAEEMQFWSPVSYYDFEYEQNEKKKEILLIDNRYKQSVEDELSRVFRS